MLATRKDVQFETHTDLVRRYCIYIEARVKGAALKPKVEERRSLAEGETTRRVLPESTEESLFRYVEHVSSSAVASVQPASPFRAELREQTITLPRHASNFSFSDLRSRSFPPSSAEFILSIRFHRRMISLPRDRQSTNAECTDEFRMKEGTFKCTYVRTGRSVADDGNSASKVVTCEI